MKSEKKVILTALVLLAMVSSNANAKGRDGNRGFGPKCENPNLQATANSKTPGCHCAYSAMFLGFIVWPFGYKKIIRADHLVVGARDGYGCELEDTLKRIKRKCSQISDEEIIRTIVHMDDGYAFCQDMNGATSVFDIKQARRAILKRVKLENPEACK